MYIHLWLLVVVQRRCESPITLVRCSLFALGLTGDKSPFVSPTLPVANFRACTVGTPVFRTSQKGCEHGGESPAPPPRKEKPMLSSVLPPQGLECECPRLRYDFQVYVQPRRMGRCAQYSGIQPARDHWRRTYIAAAIGPFEHTTAAQRNPEPWGSKPNCAT